MNLDELVFDAIAKRGKTTTDDITFFAKHFWHSFEEWLNWEAVLGCRDAGLNNVWPKTALPLFIVASMYHPENPQNKQIPDWFTKWVQAQENDSRMGIPMKHKFELPENGWFDVKGWGLR